MKKSSEKLPFNFNSKKPLEVNFSGLDLSSDAGLLLVKQAEENLKVAQGISTCLEDDRQQTQVKLSLFQLVINIKTMRQKKNLLLMLIFCDILPVPCFLIMPCY